jgi:hypothetical protein
MASIKLLDYHQQESDTPRRHVNRSKAQLHVRRSEAYWVIPGKLLRLLPPHQEPDCTDYAEAVTTLPPIELPGIKVVGIQQSACVVITLDDFARDNPLRA